MLRCSSVKKKNKNAQMIISSGYFPKSKPLSNYENFPSRGCSKEYNLVLATKKKERKKSKLEILELF
jgi:hypothetical protein